MDVLCPVQPPLGILISGLNGTRPSETVEQISLHTPCQQLYQAPCGGVALNHSPKRQKYGIIPNSIGV